MRGIIYIHTMLVWIKCPCIQLNFPVICNHQIHCLRFAICTIGLLFLLYYTILDVSMGCFDGTEVCELVGSYILQQLSQPFEHNSVGLYRDDGLATLKDLIKVIIVVKGHISHNSS